MLTLEIDPQQRLLEGMENGAIPDMEGLALAREYALEAAKDSTYENDIVRLWHSPAGLFYEFKQFQAAFYGRLGEVQGEYLGTAETQGLVWEALSLARKNQAEVSVFYTAQLMQSPQDFYLSYTLDHQHIERGEARYALPLFMRFQTSTSLTVLLRLEGEFLCFKLAKGAVPVLKGLQA